ncbi:hypothetical protein GNIT_3569 [Glaciecola nitratireducens FR1064]|uniref:Uncharacterized protein n=1 Tax=Glaciecola nitratireducens (strain JCM 12485 / KCTC 12276 / FR1064) TaxID=1085623 RepID=G4QNV5_GLANF|nr:hypothetical protein GNIT_3569 [Glaciecola nitratireducens FR1064]
MTNVAANVYELLKDHKKRSTNFNHYQDIQSIFKKTLDYAGTLFNH